MNGRDRESTISKTLKSGTDRAAEQKQKVWRSISGRIGQAKMERKRDDMRRNRIRWIGGAAAAAVVVLASVYFSTTPEGTALADRIVKIFSPEKRINTQIEGGTETQNAALQGNTSKEMGYVIYIDSERYRKETAGGVDYYKAISMPEGYPPVQMEISQLADRGAEETYHKLLDEAGNSFDVAEGKGKVEKPVKGWSLFAYDNGGGDAPYEDVYIVDNKKGGCFVIRCRLFREASEGHGARYYAMLETFEVVDSSQLDTALPETSAKPQLQPKKLTWDDLALYGVKLDTLEEDALAALSVAIGKEPKDTRTENDAGGTTRTVIWEGGATAVIRNGKLYSLEAADPAAILPNGLHAGMSLQEFTAVLGEPHEAIGAVAWGVGSNDNLIAVVRDGTVVTVKVSLVE